MAAVAPTIGWTNVACVGYFYWHNPNFAPGDLGDIIMTIPAGTPIEFVALAAGDVSFTITGDLQPSMLITNLSSTSEVAAGQFIQCPSIPYDPASGRGGPYPAIITAVYVASSSLAYANGMFDGDEDTFIDNLAPTVAVNGVTLTVTDYMPAGEFAAVVSPGTGVTIEDQNADGTGNVSHIGDGLAICNLIGDAFGDFEVSFANAGDYTVTCKYTSSDPNYATVTLSPPVKIVVT
jgi:hypothetical protein